MKMMKINEKNIIPTAPSGTVDVLKLKKGTDNKLVFKKIYNPMWFEVEIIYADKSLGTYETNSFNEIIILFFKKLAKFNLIGFNSTSPWG